MLSHYNAICKYVGAERAMIGDERANLTAEQQHLHLIDTFKRMPPDHNDAFQLLDALRIDTPSFTHAQRQSIASAVSSVVNAATPGQALIKSDKRQTHMYSYNYVPQWAWTKLLDKDLSFEEKMDVMADVHMDFGCRNPSEISRASMIASIAVASDIALSPEQQYQRVHDLGIVFATKQTLASESVFERFVCGCR